MFRLKREQSVVNARTKARVKIRTREVGGGAQRVSGKASATAASVRFLTDEACESLFFGLVRGVHELVEASAAVPAAEDFHVKNGIEENIPQVALRIADVDREALGTANVLASGVLLHWDQR